MNQAGYLRLMLTEPRVMNMSNTLRGIHRPETLPYRVLRVGCGIGRRYGPCC